MGPATIGGPCEFGYREGPRAPDVLLAGDSHIDDTT